MRTKHKHLTGWFCVAFLRSRLPKWFNPSFYGPFPWSMRSNFQDCLFEARSHSLAQAGLELIIYYIVHISLEPILIHLPPSPKCWNLQSKATPLALVSLFNLGTRRLRGFKTILLRTLHIVILKSPQIPCESSLTC